MNFAPVVDGLPGLLQGLGVTLLLAVSTLLLGLTIAIPFAIARWSGPKWLSSLILCYTFCIRGTPLLVQLFLIYYGSGQFRNELETIGLWWFFREPWNCALLAFTLSTAAYTTEILRGALMAVSNSQLEAGYAYGFSGFQKYRFIILPQAFAIAMPTYSNEIIFHLQATSLASLITIEDLAGRAGGMANDTYLPYEFYLTAASMYLVVVYSALNIMKRLEKALTRFRYSGAKSEV
jgi:His/Glu/Gln/Arg/opine family amino acid ABC transporter permease subunit